MKVITLGNGYVASHLPYEISKVRLIPSQDEIGAFLDSLLEKDGVYPDVIVNAIGFCGRPNVDQCETMQARTYMGNVVMPAMLAQECQLRAIRMIHIGSGCIYFGESPHFAFDTCKCMGGCNCAPPRKIDLGWEEDDIANPKSYYSKSKYACDLILGQMPNVTTLRIRMPISTQNNPRNFINKIRGYSQVIDIPNSVTFMDDLTRCVDWAITTNQTGIFHVTNPTPLSAADVMREYQKYDSKHKFSIIDEAELDRITIAKRSNCIINSRKLLKAGFRMTPTEDALKDCMAAYIKNI